MPDYETLYPGRFLKKRSLEAPKVIRITRIVSEQLEGDKGLSDEGILYYKSADGDGQTVWPKTNSILTAAALGERDYEKWAGRLLTIYFEPEVQFGKEMVGGIRVLGSPEMKQAEDVTIKFPKKAKETWRLVPTDSKGSPKVAGGRLDRQGKPSVFPKGTAPSAPPASPPTEAPPPPTDVAPAREPGAEG